MTRLECVFCRERELVEVVNIRGDKQCSECNAWTCPTCLTTAELMCLFCTRAIHFKHINQRCRNGALCFVHGIKLLHKSDEHSANDLHKQSPLLLLYQPNTSDLRYLPLGSKIMARDKKTISIQLGDDPERYPVCHALCISVHEAYVAEQMEQEKNNVFIPPSNDDPWDKPEDEDWQHSSSDEDDNSDSNSDMSE